MWGKKNQAIFHVDSQTNIELQGGYINKYLVYYTDCLLSLRVTDRTVTVGLILHGNTSFFLHDRMFLIL